MVVDGVDMELVPEQLTGAFAHANRAQNLLVDFKEAVIVSEREALGLLRAEFDPDTGNYVLRIPHPDTLELSEAPKVVVGDIAHNLRSALDYLIYELSLHNVDSKGNLKATQFVVVDTPNDFPNQSNRYLSQLTPQQIDMVEALQPYKGIRWTALIRDLNNLDKHRHLVDVLTHWSQAHVFFGSLETVEKEAAHYPGVKVIADVDGKGNTTCSVGEIVEVYIDGRPAESVFNHLYSSVCSTFSDFAPQFA